MKKILRFSLAAKISLVLYFLLLVFHVVLIIAGSLNRIPFDIVWGGNLNSKEQFIFSEITAVAVTLICLFLTSIKAGYLKLPKLYQAAHIAMWIFFGYFLLNTVGNLLSKTLFEKSMALLSFILSLLMLRMGLERKTDNT